MQAAALEEDPSIFDYDSHYDAQQSQREAAKPTGQAVRKSRYIESLLDKTKERQREQDIIYERKCVSPGVGLGVRRSGSGSKP